MKLNTLLATVRRNEALSKERDEEMAGTAQEILAKVTANTDVLESIAVAADELNEGFDDISQLIADLKSQIGNSADLTELEEAVDKQATVAAGLKTAVGANTAKP